MFRIYTEDTNRKSIRKILGRKFQGYTIEQAQGVWHGKSEPSLLIDVEQANAKKVHEVAREIKKANKQEAVLVSEFRSKPEMI